MAKLQDYRCPDYNYPLTGKSDPCPACTRDHDNVGMPDLTGKPVAHLRSSRRK